MFRIRHASAVACLLIAHTHLAAQHSAPGLDPRLEAIARAPSAGRIADDVRTLAAFGTRHTFSDTLSPERGIGAARRWIFAEFERISATCGGCLDVRYTRSIVPGRAGTRITQDTEIVNVIAIQRGTTHPDRIVLMSGDIDSRASDVMDAASDAPGANDNASGMAGTLEAARVLSAHRFGKTIIYSGLSGEEQGLFGGAALAREILDSGWTVEAVLNNDMIGNIAGINGEVDNRSFRIFSEPVPPGATEAEQRNRRVYGGEVDGPSRQLARYIEVLTRQVLPEMRPRMIYRLDRFGRGGHHRPFNDLGMPGVRIMEMHEHYDRQHQNLRTEDGRHFGDVIDFVDFPYAATLTGVNAATLAALAWAPPPPTRVRIQGAVSPSTSISWQPVPDDGAIGYRIWWRDTTSPQWEHSRFIPAGRTLITLEGVVIDHWLFGVAAVGPHGHESVVQFPVFGR